MKDNQRDIQEISPSNLKINIINNKNNLNNNINNNKTFKDISELSSIIDENKEKNKYNNQPKRRPINKNMEFNLANLSVNNNNNNLNNELNTNNTNENNITPVSTSLLQKMVDKADILVMEIINGFSLEKNLKIEINPLGMIKGSKRNAKDGFTYFGLIDNDIEEEKNEIETNKSVKETDKNKEVDFEINSNDINANNENSNILGRHFRIRFDINTMKYYIKDLGHGYGTFKKIIKKAKIKDTYLINIGNSYIVCTFGVDEYYPEGKGNYVESGDKTLNIRVFSDIPQTEPYFFNPNQFKRIYIGRDISCNIIIDDSLLSRVHCTIDYTEEEDGWIIYDGKIDDDVKKNKPSTNGTWLFLIEESEINDGLIFKNNKNAFECHFIKPNKES